MKIKRFVMLIAVLVLSICLTMAFGITAFADGEETGSETAAAAETQADAAPAEDAGEITPASDAPSEIVPEEVPPVGQDGGSDEGKVEDESPIQPEIVEPSQGPELTDEEEPVNQESENPAEEIANPVITADFTGKDGATCSLELGGSVDLGELIANLGYEGEIDFNSFVSSKPEALDIDEQGKLVFKQAFGDETITVVINGADVVIPVHDPTPVGTEDAIRTAFSNATPGEEIQLTVDIDISSTLEVAGGKNFTLDLNGHVLKMTGNGSVITIENGGNFTLKDSKPANAHEDTSLPAGGVITGGYGDQAGGVLVKASNQGTAGTFTMKGGNIFGNTSTHAGGGVYLGTEATFNMEGGSIVSNKANGSGGGVCVTSAFFTMSGGKIENNDAQAGGGVYNDKGTFTMTGGEIGNNTAAMFGGGVCIGNGTFSMSRGKIEHNEASQGGGVYYNNGTVTLGGDAKITDNTLADGITANNLYLPNGKTVTVGTGVNAPKAGMSIGVTLASGTGDVTTADGEAAKCFTSDNKDYFVVNKENKVQLAAPVAAIGETKYASVQDAVNASGSGDLITMLADSVISKTLTVSDKTVTLDLNGHVLKRTDNDNDDGNAIDVLGGYLTLRDSNPSAEHTGEFASLPAGGVITGGKKYGGVWVNGVFSMESGTICGNTSNSGGGVYNIGTFNMTGGAISDNSALYGGGGVTNFGTFTMTGGIITENSSGYANGVYDEGTMTVGGTAMITGNVNDNLFLVDGHTVTIGTGDDAPQDSMLIGVTLASGTGDVTTGNGGGAAKYFTSDNSDYVPANKDGKVQLVAPVAEISGKKYGTVQDAIDAANTNDTIKMLADSTENVTIYSDNSITLDLNGKTLTGMGNGSVITVRGNFTLTDSVGGGKITGGNAFLGGGVLVGGYSESCSSFTMTGGTISGNTAGNYGSGGGVYVLFNGTFTMTGGTITGNTASYGGGVYNYGSMTVGGNAQIIGNTKSDGLTLSNLYLPSDKTVTIGKDAQAPTTGMLIGVTLASETGDVTTANGEAAKYFNSDDSSKVPVNKDGKVQLVAVETGKVAVNVEKNKFYDKVSDAVNDTDASVGDTIKMLADSVENNSIIIVDGKTVTLDLNGHVLDFTRANGEGIIVQENVNLTLKDSNPTAEHSSYKACPAGGVITKAPSGGVHVYGGGTFNMYGGTIYKNGSVGDEQYSIGGQGGVHVYGGGTFNMYGGTISQNESSGEGAGVYNGGEFNMYGGTITENKSRGNGAGVYVYNKATMTVGGEAVITRNNLNDGTENNLYLPSGKTVTVNDGFNGAIGVTTKTKPTAKYPVDVTGVNNGNYKWCFTSDENYTVVNTANNVVQLLAYKSVEIPTAETGLVYNGEEQIGVKEGEGYTLEGNYKKMAGTYTAKATLKEGYIWSDGTFDVKEILWSITPKQLTVTGTTVADKTYDGTTDANATVGDVSGIVEKDKDAVTVSIDSAVFADANAGTDKKVTVSYKLTGTAAGNYVTPVTDDNLKAGITQKEVTLNWTAPSNLVYDGSEKVPTVTAGGLISGDECTVTAVLTDGKNNINVGTFAFTATALSNNNYKLPSNVTSDEYTITPKQLTVSGTTVADKYYDGTTDAEVTIGTVSGVIEGDDVTVAAVGTFDTAEIGANKKVSVVYSLSGTVAGNYTILPETLTASILEKPIPTPGEAVGKVSVYVDGKLLTEGTDYNWVNGKVQFTDEFLNTLEEGEHTLKVDYSGYVVKEIFDFTNGTVVPRKEDTLLKV